MEKHRNSLISEGIRNMLRIWVREYQLIFTDLGVLVIIFAISFLYPLLYSGIYYPEVVRDMPVAVVDLSHTSGSRRFIREVDATPELKCAFVYSSMEDAIRQLKERNIHGIVQIPASFASDLALGKQANISAYADMRYFLYYRALSTGIRIVSYETGHKIQVENLEKAGMSSISAESTAEPFKLDDNAMANRTAGFASYGIPASLILIIQQTLILAIGVLAGTARERHTFGTLVPLDRKRMGALRLVFGKAAAYFSIYAILSVYILGFIPKWFGYGRLASFHELAVLVTPFILSSIFMGMTLSVLFMKRESAMMLYLFTSIPLLFLSGIIWPLSAFSETWLIVREIFPSSNAIMGFIKMNSLGATVYETRKEILALWIQTGFYFLTACLVYALQVEHSEELRENISHQPASIIRSIIAKRMAERRAITND